VTEEAFIAHFRSTAYGKSIKDASLASSYGAYLKKIFATGFAMMPHKSNTEIPTLGAHCFK